MKRTICLLISCILVIPVLSGMAQAARIKDLAKLNSVRTNQLIGYGLITGLNGTGDDMKKSGFTLQSIYNMMVNNGITMNPKNINDIKVKNVASVMVTASLPPFAKPGSTIDVAVSSIGDSKNLAGGTLIMTPLKGADGQVYAVAQGPITLGRLLFWRQGGQGPEKSPDRRPHCRRSHHREYRTG